jgi:FkbM family methyltransferase
VKRAVKAALELALPLAEQFTGFRTPRGDYLPNRLRMLTGRYEEREIGLIRQFLRPGQTIVDVGAHVGYFSRLFGEVTGAQGKVYAFEPNPLIFPLLKENVAHLQHVFVFNYGLSSRAGRSPLFLAGNNHSVASFAKDYPASHLAFHGNAEVDPVEAQVVVGDEFLHRAGIEQVDLIKMDVEGWEIDALSGLERTITASKGVTVSCEFNPAAQKCAGRGRNELLEWFLDRQFNLACLRAGELQTFSRSSMDDAMRNLGPLGYATIFATKH